MKKSNILLVNLLLALTLLAGCASFGIQSAAHEEGRENRDYTLLVKAWEKDTDEVGVTFMYRVNGGFWKAKMGIFNGTLYEAKVDGVELGAGVMEYYAWMTTAKGKKITSKPVSVKILSYAQAKNKAEKQYLANLSDGGTDNQFIFNETALVKLKVAGTDEPQSVQSVVGINGGTKVLTGKKTAEGFYEADIPAPHTGASYSHQWTVKWQDSEFGEIVSQYPPAPKFTPILDQAALMALIKKEFNAALTHTGPVAGNFFSPPIVQAKLNYSQVLAKYSTGLREVFLVLGQGDFVKSIKMAETATGVFRTEIPVKDLESGALSYTFKYSDTFAMAGQMQADYLASTSHKIEYKNFETMKMEASTLLRSKFVHQIPSDAVEGSPLEMKVSVQDKGMKVLSVTLDGMGKYPIGKNISFIAAKGDWLVSIPGALVRPGTSSYTITTIVRDPRFGDIKIILPEGEFYTVQVKSLSALRAEKETGLQKKLSHSVPQTVEKNKELVLVMEQSAGLQNARGTLFYRTANSKKYRELTVNQTGNAWVFTVDAAETHSAYIQYYFTVSVADPLAGTVTATLKSTAGGVEGDFIVAPVAPGNLVN